MMTKAEFTAEVARRLDVTGEGLLARAICHECEHLDGILYVEHVEGELYDVSYDEEEAFDEIDELTGSR